MEKVITKIRGKVYLKDIIKKYHLEKTMCEFSVSVFTTKHGKSTMEVGSQILAPMHRKLKGNEDYVDNRIIIFNEPSKTLGKDRDMGILFWYPYNLKNVPDDLIFNPGRYSITVKTIDNKE